MNRLGRALQFFKPEGHRLVLVAFFLLAAVAASLLRPWPLATIVDAVLLDLPYPRWLQTFADSTDRTWMLGLLAAGFFGLHLAQAGLWMILNFVSIPTGLEGMRRAREEMFSCLQRVSARFIQAARAGDLVHRTANDTYSLHIVFQKVIVTSLAAALIIIGILVVLWRMNGVLTLVVLILIPMLLLAARYFDAQIGEWEVTAQQAESQVSSFVQFSIAALPLTLSSGRDEHETSNFSSRTAAALQKRRALVGWELAYWCVVAAIIGVGAAGVSWLGAKSVLAGKMTVGDLLVFLAYLPLLHEPVRHLSRVAAIAADAKVGIARIFELLDTPEQVTDTGNPRPAVDPRVGPAPAAKGPAAGTRTVRVTGNIEFDAVSYGEVRGATVLQNISFRVAAGQTVAIVGPHAVAKSTILNLAARFFDPSSGVVRIEGVDLRELRLKDWRARLAIVSPEPILLPASISENIAYGKPRARRGEIEAAARAAHAEDFIARLPNGYQTMIGEGGTRLNASQRLRLDLARAFLRDANIVLFEENPSTSSGQAPSTGSGQPPGSTDHDADELMAPRFEELFRGRTVLVVAHRPSTLRRANRIIVIRDGRIVEDGAPADLRQGDGYFAKLAQGQLALD